ncbi:hypothetical protein NC653_040465 [Populus alba x Populus x berolinensis]|uniref:Uncharacterized protein n=1 Tax=Populus alba x Populus x berolinensis TaxID=444605 RepID=A0AAD6L667_9ROSI|nr:hypothetical protein NC653_040465 [Populus alba x Populus x berolinensis]
MKMKPLMNLLKHTKHVYNDLMYFPTRNAYGLSSVAGNMEKLTALQNEFENVKTRLEAEREKALRLEKKVNVLTQGYQMRAERQLLPPIELTLKQMDTSGTELECFQALQRQEQLAHHTGSMVFGRKFRSKRS